MKVFLIHYKDIYHEAEYVVAASNKNEALAVAVEQETSYSLDGKNIYRPDLSHFTVMHIDGVSASKGGLKTVKKI